MSRRTWVSATLVILLAFGGAAGVLARDGAPPSIVVLARADNPVDALGASAVAAQLGGVVLLTGKTGLDEAAKRGILARDPDLVILAGGPAALEPQVEQDVQDLDCSPGKCVTRRVAGQTRTETAEEIAKLLTEFPRGYVAVSEPGARAQAVVWGSADNPGLDPDRSYGFTAVTTPIEGVYCLTLDASRGIDLNGAVVLTSIEWGDSTRADLLVHWNGEWDGADEGGCPAGQVDISTYTPDGGLTSDASFVVVIP